MVGTRLRKATFSLDEKLLLELSDAVGQGAAPTKNAFVERALRRELKEARRQRRRTLWLEAAEDPLFQRDIADVEADFAAADAESARAIR